jgi:hypothetical protein
VASRFSPPPLFCVSYCFLFSFLMSEHFDSIAEFRTSWLPSNCVVVKVMALTLY